MVRLLQEAELYQWYLGQALANPAICTGEASQWQLKTWFGERNGITRMEIIVRQAREAADEMRKLGHG